MKASNDLPPVNRVHSASALNHLFSTTTITLLWLLVVNVSAQNRTITGTVTTAEDGLALPGVNIIVNGTTRGTTTDANGKYSLSVPTSSKTLIFSFVGFEVSEEEVGERGVVDVKMKIDANELGEIVVTGTGVPTEKRKLAFAVETINNDELPLVPTASIGQALIGKIPGAFILSGNGVPGASVNILLRGINSTNRGTSPMILVDGLQMNSTDLRSLDLSTIDRLEVIQGAAAATIYGAQGANGVIQVFTKRGEKGKLKIDFSASVANNRWLNTGGLAKARFHSFKTNSDNYVIAANGDTITQDPNTLIYNDNVIWTPLVDTVQNNKPYNRNLTYHDHFKEFYTDALTTKYNLSVSGGSDKVDFILSASNTKQQNNFKGDGYNDRSNFISNIGISFTPKLTFRSISQMVYTKNTVNIYNKPAFNPNGQISGILNSRPFGDYWIKDNEGNYGSYYGDAPGPNVFNPNYSFQYSTTQEKTLDIIQNLNLEFKPIKQITLDVKYGINHQRGETRHEVDNQSMNNNVVASGNHWEAWFNGTDNRGEISTFQNKNTSQNFLSTATVNLDLKNDFNFGFPLRSITMVAFDYRNRLTHDYNTYGLGLPLLPPKTANQATTFRIDRDFKTEFITYGYLVNQRFEWDQLAGVSGGFRSDYSSAFGKGSKPFTFPRGDAFVRVSALDFWNSSGVGKVILEWKLRGAFGKAGIQPNAFDRFPTLATRTVGNVNSYFVGAAQANPDLNVEVSRETELGTDLVFERLSRNWLTQSRFSFSYWNRKTENAIFRVDAAPTSGVGTILDNAYTIASNGLQFSLVLQAYKSNNLSWTFTTNFGRQNSVVESIKGDAEIAVGWNVLKPGDQVGQFYGYLMLNDLDAINPATSERFIHVDSTQFYQVAGNGWVVDKRTKRPFMSSDKYALGDPYPDFNASFIHDFTFKKCLSFGFQLDWVKGGNIYNMTKSLMYRDGIHRDYDKAFEIEGDVGAWTAFYQGVYLGRAANDIKNYFYEDGSFVRLRNVYVGLDVARLLNLKLRKLQLILTGRNLATWTNYTGMDPEVNSFAGNNLAQRLDHNTLPNFRTYQITLNLGI
jgi:TonB-linked SusC/RagA family outer membrane protein